MDPLTAIGLVSNILSFIDFSQQLLRGANEIHGSLFGTLDENKSREVVVGQMKIFSSKLLAPDSSTFIGEDKELCGIAAEYLERRLNSCRAQLGLQLNFLTSRESRARLDALVDASRSDSSKLEHFQKQIDHLRERVEDVLVSTDAQGQFQRLFALQQEALTPIANDRILRSLSFEGMHGRFDMVDKAHRNTFQWVFETISGLTATFDGESQDDSSEPEDKHKQRARERLLSWLASGNGIFHISGKLGSGKSTLMKFLCDHPRTRSELRKWAGTTLVLANFFFWAPGSERQKSLAGLSRPDLIPKILPEYWYEALSSPCQLQTSFVIPDARIREAFTKLILSEYVSTSHSFCFFIDGLDEFRETTQDDHISMTKLLRNWVDVTPGTVKLCVSSREYNVFMNAFSPDSRLRLHDLTKRDMEGFVRDKLEHLADNKNKATLINAIVNKAGGIFLWVTLVVKSMREELESGSTVDQLTEELETLPDELEGLFGHILRSLKKQARKRAYQTMVMLRECKEYEHSISLFAYSFLDQYEHDHAFAMASDFAQSQLSDTEREDKITLARKKLSGWCKGLVEADAASNLEYTHRSIPEFLQIPYIEAELAQVTEGFSGIDAISQLSVYLGRDFFPFKNY
ncbi:hypothetical protein GQ53DRAFT_777337 [Thozetella sp. PMI_491]|nr:hypothetical protein GQ53DRAFT_777337 [Thozetella sp. PMI_491]